MDTTVIGVYEIRDHADNAMNDLIANGFSRDHIEMHSGSEVLSAGSSESTMENDFADKSRRFLDDVGLGGKRDGELEGKIRDDDSLLFVDTDEDKVDLAIDILNRFGAVDLDERGGYVAAPSEKIGKEEPLVSGSEAAGLGEGKTLEPGQKIPIIEEELEVGKRTLKHGGVRIFSHKVERPVDEQVHLHKEKVHVERHPVNREASEADLAAFKEGSMEISETSEEPVVSKHARVKEEVTVSKESYDTSETIHETLRGTEVEVERLSPEEESEFAAFEPEFKDEAVNMYAAEGTSYDELRPYYRYGYHMGHDKYPSSDWGEVEPKIKNDWEDHQYGPWERYKNVVKRGWERGAHRQ